MKWHPDRVPGPCAVCSKIRDPPRYWHIGQAQPQHANLVMQLREMSLGMADCVCRSCQLKLEKHGTDEPPVKVAKLQLPHDCSYSGCVPKPDERIHTILNDDSNRIQHLCHKHFLKVSSVICYVCDKSANWAYTECHFRPVQTLAHAAYEYNKLVIHKENMQVCTNDTMICDACRRYVVDFADTDEYKDILFSDDCQFKTLFVDLHIDQCNDVRKVSDFSFCKAMVFLEDKLLNDKVTFLQTVYQHYCAVLHKICMDLGVPQHYSSHLHNHEWFRHKMDQYIGEAVVYTSVNQKIF